MEQRCHRHPRGAGRRVRILGGEPLDEPWSNEPGYHLISDGTPEGTHLLLDGRVLPGIIHIEWEADALSPTRAIVIVPIVKADIIGFEPRWVGLEEVPIEALEAELENRK